MDHGFFWLTGHDFAIAHLDDDGLTAVGAERIYPDQLARKQPVSIYDYHINQGNSE